MGECRVVKKGSEHDLYIGLFASFFEVSALLGVFGDSAEQVLNSSIFIIEGSSEGGSAALAVEAHGHEFGDVGL